MSFIDGSTIVGDASCDSARQQAALVPDGELSFLEVRQLDAHLKRCPACAAFASDVNALTTLLRRQPMLPSPRATAPLESTG